MEEKSFKKVVVGLCIFGAIVLVTAGIYFRGDSAEEIRQKRIRGVKSSLSNANLLAGSADPRDMARHLDEAIQEANEIDYDITQEVAEIEKKCLEICLEKAEEDYLPVNKLEEIKRLADKLQVDVTERVSLLDAKLRKALERELLSGKDDVDRGWHWSSYCADELAKYLQVNISARVAEIRAVQERRSKIDSINLRLRRTLTDVTNRRKLFSLSQLCKHSDFAGAIEDANEIDYDISEEVERIKKITFEKYKEGFGKEIREDLDELEKLAEASRLDFVSRFEEVFKKVEGAETEIDVSDEEMKELKIKGFSKLVEIYMGSAKGWAHAASSLNKNNLMVYSCMETAKKLAGEIGLDISGQENEIRLILKKRM